MNLLDNFSADGSVENYYHESFSAKEMRFCKIFILLTTSSRFIPIGFIAKNENSETAEFLKLLKVFSFIFLNMRGKWSVPRWCKSNFPFHCSFLIELIRTDHSFGKFRIWIKISLAGNNYVTSHNIHFFSYKQPDCWGSRP